MNNPFGMMQQFQQFVQNFRRNINRNPRDIVQELLNSGQMSQQQYEEYRRRANQIMGINH